MEENEISTEETTVSETTETPVTEENSISEGEVFRKKGEEHVHIERLKMRRAGEAERRAIEAEFRKINAIDPSVKTFDDLILMENSEEFAAKVRKGYSLYDAFILTNGKKLSQRIKNQAVRAALSRLGAKQHLTGAGTGGGEAAIDVPAETYSLYKSLYPNITDKEIRAHYKNHNK